MTLLVDQAAGSSDVKKQNADTSSKVKATILAHSSKKSWTATGSIDLNPQQRWQPPSAAALKPSTLAVYLTGSFTSYFAGKPVPSTADPADANRTVVASNTNGHLAVVSCADFISAQNAAPGNVMMAVNLVDWLSQDENLIAVRSKTVKDRTIEADLLKKGSPTPNIVRFINIVTMPLLVIIAGLLIFFRRREHIAAASTPAASGEKTEEKRS
jgi:ABC-2 type transport system permease protein